MIKYCKRCCLPSTKPHLSFDEEGICNACRNYENRKSVDWDERKAELMEILDRYRSKDHSNWDCIIPVSGGKDSTYQVITMLELGMNHAGEIDYLSAIVEPDMILMTNIGDSHIEHFGSREKILEAKSEIFHYAKPGAPAIINGDDPLLNTLPGKLDHPFIRVGSAEGLDYRAVDLASDGKSRITCKVETPDGDFQVEIPALGDHMIYPTLMATAVGRHFGLTEQEIADGVLHFAPTKMRMNILSRADDITILNDTYNANPQSMRAAISVLADSRSAWKLAVLGDMFELGPYSPALHTGVGEYLGKRKIDCLVAVGDQARYLAEGAQSAGMTAVYPCADKKAARELLPGLIRPDSTILVKASRGMRMEELVDQLLELTPEQ